MPRSPNNAGEDGAARSPLSTNYYQLEDNGAIGSNASGAALSPSSPASRSSRFGGGGSRGRGRPFFTKDDTSVTSAGFSQSPDFKRMLNEKTKPPPPPNPDECEEVYVVKQRYGYFSILFSLAQCGVLFVMMAECGVAPLNINPMVGPYPDALSEWGGKNAVNILEDGEWWRLITPIMLHAGVIHLLCNIAVQVETGAFFEREWGSITWLIIYLVSAVGSSALSVIVMPDAISVGSSGAVMGLFGGKLAEVICKYCENVKTEQGRIGHQVRKEQCAGVTCSVTIVMLFSFIPYVDWAAHLGGLIAGFCIGIVLFAAQLEKMIWKCFWLIMGFGFVIMYFTFTFEHMYSGDIEVAEELRDVCGYYQQYFEDYECNCMREEHERI